MTVPMNAQPRLRGAGRNGGLETRDQLRCHGGVALHDIVGKKPALEHGAASFAAKGGDAERGPMDEGARRADCMQTPKEAPDPDTIVAARKLGPLTTAARIDGVAKLGMGK